MICMNSRTEGSLVDLGLQYSKTFHLKFKSKNIAK